MNGRKEGWMDEWSAIMKAGWWGQPNWIEEDNTICYNEKNKYTRYATRDGKKVSKDAKTCTF